MPRIKGQHAAIYTYGESTGTLYQLHRQFGWDIGVKSLEWRVKHGLSLAEAVTLPLNQCYRNPQGQWRPRHEVRALAHPASPSVGMRFHDTLIRAKCVPCAACGVLLLPASLTNGRCAGGCQTWSGAAKLKIGTLLAKETHVHKLP